MPPIGPATRASTGPLDCVEPAPDGEIRADPGPYRLKDLDQQSGPVGGHAAPAVVALIVGRREEAVDEVAMAGVVWSRPDVPGAGDPMVCTIGDLASWLDVDDPMVVGPTVAVIGGPRLDLDP